MERKMGKIKTTQAIENKAKKKDLFANKLATVLLVQSKLLPSSALGIKDLNDKI